MDRTNAVVAVGFASLGVYLIVSGGSFPAGIGGLPGAGFFPAMIGSLIVLLALALLFQSRRPAEGGAFELANLRQILGAAAMLFLYLALWGTGLFPLRTAIFLALLLKFLGQEWRAAVSVSVALTVVATAAFQYGLNVSLE